MIRSVVCADSSLRSHGSQRGVAQRLLRRGLRESFGLASDDVRLIRNSFGKPIVAGRSGVHVSVSYTDGAVVVACSDKPIGVDVERLRHRDRYAAARMLPVTEIDRIEGSDDPDREFFRQWVVRESYVKALGVGLSYPVRTLDVAVGADGSATLNRLGTSARLDESVDGLVIATCCLRGSTEDAVSPVEHIDLAVLEEG